jgi:hypothetical protein
MEQNEIAEQLIALAQTPEQIQYLTSNDTTILTDRVNQMKAEHFRREEEVAKRERYYQGMNDAYRTIILDLFGKKNEHYCDC